MAETPVGTSHHRRTCSFEDVEYVEVEVWSSSEDEDLPFLEDGVIETIHEEDEENEEDDDMPSLQHQPLTPKSTTEKAPEKPDKIKIDSADKVSAKQSPILRVNTSPNFGFDSPLSRNFNNPTPPDSLIETSPTHKEPPGMPKALSAPTVRMSHARRASAYIVRKKKKKNKPGHKRVRSRGTSLPYTPDFTRSLAKANIHLPLSAPVTPTTPETPPPLKEMPGVGDDIPYIQVRIQEARNLRGCDRSGSSDPYCVVQVLDKEKKVMYEGETDVVKKDLNPLFQRSYFAWVLEDDSKSTQVEKLRIKVYDKDKFFRDEFMGLVEFELAKDNPTTEPEWFPLQKRKKKDKVSGAVNVELKYKSKKILDLERAFNRGFKKEKSQVNVGEYLSGLETG